MSSWSARERIEQARLLVGYFPQILELVTAGRVSLLQARMVYLAAQPTIDRLRTNGHDVAGFTAALREALVARLPELTCGQVRTETTRLAARLAPRTVEQAHTQAYAERRVTAKPLPDGMGLPSLYSGADEITQIFTTLTARTRNPDPGDERSIDQRRADLLHEWSITALNPALATTDTDATTASSCESGTGRSMTDDSTNGATDGAADAGDTSGPASSAAAAGSVRQDAGCGVPLWQGRRPAIQGVGRPLDPVGV